MIKWAVLLSTLCCAVHAQAAQGDNPRSPFAFVMIDAKSERTLGEFPFDRAVLAKAVERAAAMKARAVVIKFYLDQPKSAEGDRALAAAMQKIPVALAACVGPEKDRPKEPNPLPNRFVLMRHGAGGPKAIGGNSGWIPLPDFTERAAAIGFSDSAGAIDAIPMIESYQRTYVRSFWLMCLELAFNDGALVTPGRDVSLNDKSMPLDERSLATIEFPKEDRVATISFIDFINGKVPDDAIRDKVIVIGADTAKMPTVETPIGKLGIHRAMNLQLLALYEHFASK